MLELNLNHESKRGPGHRSQHLNLDYLNANWTYVNALHQKFDYLFFPSKSSWNVAWTIKVTLSLFHCIMLFCGIIFDNDVSKQIISEEDWRHSSFYYPKLIWAFGYCRCFRLCVRVYVCLYLCLCINSITSFVCVIIHHSLKLGSPNVDQGNNTPWVRSLLFGADWSWHSRSNLA